MMLHGKFGLKTYYATFLRAEKEGSGLKIQDIFDELPIFRRERQKTA